jgi:RNA polymerase sigma factor (sigma-70 family)
MNANRSVAPGRTAKTGGDTLAFTEIVHEWNARFNEQPGHTVIAEHRCLHDWSPVEWEALRFDLVAALRKLVRNHADAEELAQEVIGKGLRAGRLRDPRAWLFKVAARAGITLLRKRQRRRKCLGRHATLKVRVVPVADCAAEELRDALRAALDRLPLGLRRLVELRMTGATLAEVGDELGIHKRTAARRFQRALKLLRARLRDY